MTFPDNQQTMSRKMAFGLDKIAVCVDYSQTNILVQNVANLNKNFGGAKWIEKKWEKE